MRAGSPTPNGSRGDRRGALTALAVLALCVVLVRATFAPPAPRAADAPAHVFSATRALDVLARVLDGVGPHPAGTPAHALVRERLVRELEALGLAPQVQETLARGPDGNVALVRNVLAELPGRRDAPAVLLSAHYDSVGASPGAGDDGAGVATLLETARALLAGEGARPARENPVLLLFSDAEEVGLIGAAAFAAEHAWLARAAVAINVEARGTSGPSLMFETSSGNARLIDVFARAGGSPRASSLSEWVYKHMPNDTDFSVLRRAGLAGFNFAFIGGLEHYHTSRDGLEQLDPASVQHHGQQVLALARVLASRADLAELARVDGPEADYFDVLGRTLVRWPRAWTMWLALAALGSALWCVVHGLRIGALGPRALAFGLASVVAAPSAAILVGWAVLAALQRLRDAPDPALAHPASLVIVAHAVPLACAALAARWLGRRAGYVGAWVAAACCAALGALVLASIADGAGYLLLVPALASAALNLLPRAMLGARRGSLGRALATFLPLVASALVWLPIGLALELDFGFRLAPLPFLVPSIVLVGLLPSLCAADARLLERLALGAALSALGAVAVGLALPVHTREHPAWLNVRYIANADTGRARWDVSTYGRALPTELAAQARFAPADEPPFPWLTLDRSLWVADAPRWDVPPPALEVLAREPFGDAGAGGRRVRARFTSPRGATRLHLHLPDGARLAAVRWRGRVLEGFGAARSTIFCGLAAQGVEVELELEGEQPMTVWMLDQDWAMPDAARPLQAARPDDCVPRADGDVSILGASLRID